MELMLSVPEEQNSYRGTNVALQRWIVSAETSVTALQNMACMQLSTTPLGLSMRNGSTDKDYA